MRKTAVFLSTILVLSALLTLHAPPSAAEDWWDAMADGSFELGSPNAVWAEYSEYVGAVILQDGATAHSGVWYASFGTEWPTPESAWVEQQILLGTGAASVNFWWTRPFESENDQDILELWIDGVSVWLDRPYPGIGPLEQWINEDIDISQFADGGEHTIRFIMSATGSTNTDNGTLWFVDDVSVMTHDEETLFADFSWFPENAHGGEDVQFTDMTTGGADQWFWDFGDGQTSTLQNPIHVFESAGAWQVTLTATRTSDAAQSFKMHTVFIEEEPVSVDFTWVPTEPLVEQPVGFYSDVQGDPDVFTWTFGDGDHSSDINPNHTFSNAGEHTVTLEIHRTSDGASGMMQHVVTVLEPLAPEFIWEPLVPSVGETVTLTDLSEGQPDSWSWTFGDDLGSNEQNPTHAWETAGDFPVTLSISRGGGDVFSVTHTVTVSDDDMTSAFTWDPIEPEAGQPTSFFDQSTGDPDTWLWQFGDGHTSTLQEPVHTFEQPGEYIVTLAVSRSGDPTVVSSSENIITVGAPPPTAWFEWIPQEPVIGTVVEFVDLSTGDITAWEWDFGDGTTSSEQFPSHTYSTTGSFEVNLTVTSATGATGSENRWLAVTDDPMTADFSWIPETPGAGQPVEFLDLSQGGPVSWHWDFGNGRTSNQRHPVHWFEQGGTYNVTLTATYDADGTIQRSATHAVLVSDRPLEADFFWIPLIPTVDEVVDFTDASAGRPTTWFWQFGDGSTSEAQHPTHAFQSPGQYTVSLTVERSDGKAMSTDTKTRTIRVNQGIEIDFSWNPREPRALEPVRFTEDIPVTVGGRVWAFGDGETSTEENPTHVYQTPGNYLVQLWAADVDEHVLAVAEHEIQVQPADLEIALAVSDSTPDIGETISFHLTGVETVEDVRWAFGGIGCDGNPGQATCISSDTDDCLSVDFTFSSPGLKPVRAWVKILGGEEVGPFSTPVRVNPHGQCASAPTADFAWWPEEPVAGQPVRCIDQSVGPPESWMWTFEDGSTSGSRHATHVFASEGNHVVELMITNENGQSTVTKTVTVGALDAVCGNQICEPGENSWTCPADCFSDPDGTGRGGRKGTNLMIPAAVGGKVGANGTYWLTEGSIVNPGTKDAQVVVEFVPDSGSDIPKFAGPATIPPRTAVHFDNIVDELFGTDRSGSLWIDANQPVIANTRTFNAVGDATFGQGLCGITKNDVLGENDGSVFIVGLKQDERFRTNFLFQEVSGNHVTIDVRIFDAAGELIGTGTVNVPAKSKWQKPITYFGVSDLEAGYAVLSVDGPGKIAAIASVIDQVTGDATTLDSVHTLQTGAGTPGKTDGQNDDSHFLVAVVARTPGSNDTVWRSEVAILNSDDTDQVLELRYVPSDGEMLTATRDLPGRQLFYSEDVIEEVFPEAADGAGSLHVFAQKGLIVNSRTYNLLPDESTVGQAIPGLADGDMARSGEVWLLDSLKQTGQFRCNMGFAEFEGNDAEVTVVLFDTDGASLFFLASKKYPVPAFGQFQVNKVFHDMGLTGQFREAIAYVSVSSESGALYVYASIVDNEVGDGTTVLGKRQ